MRSILLMIFKPQFSWHGDFTQCGVDCEDRPHALSQVSGWQSERCAQLLPWSSHGELGKDSAERFRGGGVWLLNRRQFLLSSPCLPPYDLREGSILGVADFLRGKISGVGYSKEDRKAFGLELQCAVTSQMRGYMLLFPCFKAQKRKMIEAQLKIVRNCMCVYQHIQTHLLFFPYGRFEKDLNSKGVRF